ncbi:hypothetical protein BDZ97DRAFT_1922550 [Flammula alnicola]|nr:hypothetical protein BDZ97DRAFT_1922550 [Flammula alnicola]
MSLPEVYNTESYNRPDLVRLVAEWVFSPSFRQRSSTEANVIPKAPNVLCLSGPAECGKTQLAVCIAEWLGELGVLEGISRLQGCARSKSEKLTSRQLLDALPVTLVHQACTVEPDAAAQLNGAFAKNLWVLDESLEKRFDALFVTPMRAFGLPELTLVAHGTLLSRWSL